MRTTLTLDDDVFEAARALMNASCRTLGQVVSELARRGLRSSAEYSRKNGLPTFRVGADAPIIPSERAADMLSEDEP
jgi:hypothetical protein